MISWKFYLDFSSCNMFTHLAMLHIAPWCANLMFPTGRKRARNKEGEKEQMRIYYKAKTWYRDHDYTRIISLALSHILVYDYARDYTSILFMSKYRSSQVYLTGVYQCSLVHRIFILLKYRARFAICRAREWTMRIRRRHDASPLNFFKRSKNTPPNFRALTCTNREQFCQWM